MPVIEMRASVLAPIERVFDLSRSVELHMVSTARTGEAAVGGKVSGLLELGDKVTWRAKHLGVWQELTSEITAYERPVHFRDSMVKGAFRRFDHDHWFSADGGYTLIRERFEYESPLGALGRLVDVIYLARYMRIFLARRVQVVCRAAESEDWRRYVSGDECC